VPLVNNAILTFDAGFKVWRNYQEKDPYWSGFKRNVEWYIQETVDSAMSFGLFAPLAVAILAVSEF